MIKLRIIWFFLCSIVDIEFGMFCRIFVNWWAPLFCKDDGYLPNWLKWVGTFDAPLDAGVRDEYPGFDPTDSIFKNRVKWLYRNTSYGFSYWVTGIKFVPEDWTIVKDIETSDETLFFATEKTGLFNLTYQGKWGEYKIGWKAWNYWDSANQKWSDKPWGPEWRTQLVLTPNPFKKK